MAHVLFYTSPARGHLFPILGPAIALAGRDHDVTVMTLSDEVERVRSLGLAAEPISAAVEAREMDDYKGRNAAEALKLSVATFGDRASEDHDDLAGAIDEHQPDALVVDNNSWGALVAAEASGLPWCGFQPYLTPLPSRDVPPFGPGFPLAKGPLGRIRDRLLTPLIIGSLARPTLEKVNELRDRSGLAPLQDIVEFFTKPPLTLYFTAEPFEYRRNDWPDSFEMVGAATWGPQADAPEWLETIDRPIVLVTGSSERQDDRAILENTLRGLEHDDVFVVATSPAEDPDTFEAGPNARVERFLPHDPILDRAVAVVCHGGMGITQRALAKGVPVCVVPFGRDQLEVARRVERAGAGVRLTPKSLSPGSVREAVQESLGLADGARRIARAFKEAGGDERAADLVESLWQAADSKRAVTS